MTTLVVLLACVFGLAAGMWFATSETKQIEAKPAPKQVEPPKPRKRVLPPPPKTPRHITWIRARSRPKPLLQTKIGEEKPVVDGMEALGMEEYRGPALYDNGLFAIVDSTEDLVFDIVKQIDDPEMGPLYSNKRWVLVKRVNLDFDQACREADDMRRILEENPDIPL